MTLMQIGAATLMASLTVGGVACGESTEVFYVRLDGDDRNSGLANTADEAWATLAHAIEAISPGDELYLGDGVHYTEGIRLNNLHASEQQPTVLASVNPLGAKITRPMGSDPDKSVIEVSNCSHLRIVGIELYDAESGIESGVDIRDRSHHVTVEGCYIHDCACGGVSSRESDYVTIEGNIVRDNAKRNQWNCSGISFWHPIEHDQQAGFHIVIRGNVAFENECTLPFAPHGHDVPTDGNGIIVDDLRNTQGGGQVGGYQSAVLVENNLSFNNGGRGIHVYKSDNVVIRNNTVFHNLRVLSQHSDGHGDINLDHSTGSRVVNNLIVKNPNLPTASLRLYDNGPQLPVVAHNLIVGPTDYCGQEISNNSNTIRDASDQAYPAFRNLTVDVRFDAIEDFRAYFGLAADSPAIDAASADEHSPVDLEGIERERTDIGCYEAQ